MKLVMNMLIANHRALAKVFAIRSLTNVFQISPVLAIAMVTQVRRIIMLHNILNSQYSKEVLIYTKYYLDMAGYRL